MCAARDATSEQVAQERRRDEAKQKVLCSLPSLQPHHHTRLIFSLLRRAWTASILCAHITRRFDVANSHEAKVVSREVECK